MPKYSEVLNLINRNFVRNVNSMSIDNMFFGQEVFNRVSFLREDSEFVKQAINFPRTVFVPFIDGEGLLDVAKNELYMTTAQANEEIANIMSVMLPIMDTVEGRYENSGVNITFLGLEELKENSGFVYNNIYKGLPYFGIDIRCNDKTLIKSEAIAKLKSNFKSMSIMDIIHVSNRESSIYSHAKMYLDWLSKYKFCPGCGSSMHPVHGGTKLICSNTDKTIKCDIRDARVSNVSYPRTDFSIIVAITNEDYSKICLVRNRRGLKDKKGNDVKMYTTVAGFMEPSEMIENACAREIWEETGIKCEPQNVQMVLSQPWPYPVNLMLGCVAKIKFNNKNEIINLGHDKELLDAQWFDTTELINAIYNYKAEGFFVDLKGDMKIPSDSTVAFHLIKNVAEQYKKSSSSTAKL